MLEVEDWTQPGTSKRRQASKRASTTEPREDPAVPLSAPPENEVEETFHPTRAPNSRHFPAARSGTNSTMPVAGPSSLSRLLAQAPAPPPDPILLAPVLEPSSPERTPSPPLPAMSASPAQSLPATGRLRQSSPLRPGSRASRLSTSSRLSAPRLPAFGGAGGSAAKAVPTTAITAPVDHDEPGAEAIGAIPTTMTTTAAAAPPPGDSAGEGMASLLARRRTTSFHLPATGSPLAAPVPRQTAAGPAGALASLANWSSSFSRRRKMPSESATSTPPAQALAQTQTQAAAAAAAAGRGSAVGQSDAERFLQRF